MKTLDLETYGPWALVTGASSGIGAEFARKLAAMGFHLVLVSRTSEDVNLIGNELRAMYGVHYRALGLDLSRPEALADLTERTEDLEIGLVISNAGAGYPGAFLSAPPSRLLGSAQLNGLSHMALAHHYGSRMAERKRGGILLVSAMGAPQGIPFMAGDAAAKAYVFSLGRALNHEFRRHRVNVTVVLPGAVQTPAIGKLGIDGIRTPMNPGTVGDCVRESIRALVLNRPSRILGGVFRFLTAVIPANIWTRMNGNMLGAAAEVLRKRESLARTTSGIESKGVLI